MTNSHVGVFAHASDATSNVLLAPRCFKRKKGALEAVRAHDDAMVRACPMCRTPRANFELAGEPLGSARPSIGRRLTLKANAMGLSSRLFLLSADDMPHVLASAAFMRMIRREDVARVPDFAGQRVRQACIVVELVNGTPSRMVHGTFSILDIDADGLPDVERLSAQQFASLDGPLEPARPAQVEKGLIVEAARQFVARGGS